MVKFQLLTFFVSVVSISVCVNQVQCEGVSILNSCTGDNSLGEVDIPGSLVYGGKSVKFSLTESEPNCGNCTFFYSLKLPLPPTSARSIPSNIKLNYFLPDGTIRLNNEYFRKEDFCLKKITKTKIKIQFCRMECTNPDAPTTLYIPKCCEVGKSLNSVTNRCSLPGKFDWSPKLFDSANSKQEADFDKGLRPHVLIQNLTCPEPQIWTLKESKNIGIQQVPFRTLVDGNTVYFDKIRGKWINLIPGSFCLEDITFDSGKSEMLAVCEREKRFFSDQEDDDDDENILLPILYGFVMFISCGIYIATIVVHIILRRSLKFHMYIVISYTLSLLLLHIFYGSSNMIELINMHGDLNGSTLCIVVGAGSHLFILSTFSWLTMINMNLWTAFSSLNKPHSGSEGQGLVRFGFFSLFSWGLPAVVVAVGLTLDNLNKNEEILGPNYGTTRCLISAEAEGWYLFYPIGFLLLCNLAFFSLTVCRLIVYQKITRNVIGERSDKRWRIVNVYLKLLAIAVFLWAFELISWLTTQENYSWYWFIINILNLIQSGVIFTLFVCRSSVYNDLQIECPIITKLVSKMSSTCCCGEDIS